MDQSLVKNAGDEKQVREAGKKERTNRLQELGDLKAILATPHGRRFVWKILQDARVLNSSFAANELVIAFNEGRRNVGLKLMADIMEADAKALVEMMSSGLPKPEEDTNG
jgi:hypothetical protein